MRSFKEYRENKNVINESPIIDSDLNKDLMKRIMSYDDGEIIKNHHKATLIDKDNNYFHLPVKNKHYYYRHDGKSNIETSVVENNIQTNVNKKSGDVSHIHNMMLHHINTYGRLMSDTTNTEGSKRLWIGFIKKNPNVTFHASHDWVDKKDKLTSDNIDNFASNIWGYDDAYRDTRIVADK